MYNFLCNAQDGEKYNYCMIGYELGKTVTDNGSVARGVCETDENGYLTEVVERTKIEKYAGGIHYTEDDGATWTDVPATATVSMNMWGYTPSFIGEIEARFPAFLDAVLKDGNPKAEFFLPSTVSQLLKEDKATVNRARRIQRFLSQPFHVAENFTGLAGKYVPLEETIRGFEVILGGECDDIPEQAFLMCGTIDDVLAKRKQM